MTSLLIKTETIALPIDLSSVLTLSQMSDEQFQAFCRTNPNLRIERNANGKILIMSPTFADTGNRNFKIAQQLGNWADENETGEVFDSSTGFTLPNGAILSPDAAWVKRDRWNALTPQQQASFAPIVPDFVIELRSSSDTLATLQEKMQEYLDNGVPSGLLIDRKYRIVYHYRSKQSITILINPDSVNCEPELAGFVLKMAKIW